MNEPALWIALGAIAVSCYFAACSAALWVFSRSKLGDYLEVYGKKNRLKTVVEQTFQMNLICAAVRTAMNLIIVLAVWSFFESAEARLWVRYVGTFVVSGAVVCAFAVAVPFSVARYHPEGLLARSVPFLNFCLLIFGPVAYVLGLFDPVIRRMTGVENPERSGDELLTEEIISIVEDHESQATVDENRKDMLEGVIELCSTAAEQIMTPRTEMKGIEIDATLDQVREAIMELGHSRIPVYSESLDNIEGVLYAKDVIRFVGNGQAWDINAVIREAFMVPESKSVNELLAEFKKRKVHMAIVLDEYGGTAGLVTIEDVLEEIVGEIHDEYEPGDNNEPAINRINETSAVVDARVRISEINDKMDLALPENDDYDTAGGFVFSTLGHIPGVDESFEYANVKVTVTAAARTKVTRVRIDVLAQQASPSEGTNDNRHSH